MKIGIIGGSGLDNPDILQDYHEEDISTKYGKPSSKIICGKIQGVDVCILSRHGRNHEISPTLVNYKANIASLKMLGCTHIIATSAVGSLKENIKPGDLVFPSQFIDFTKKRELTFYDSVGEVQHTEMAEPFSYQLRRALIEATKEFKLKKHNFATIVIVEGPRFSTRAESLMLRNYADIIGMTTVPECTLAKEAGIEYASIAMVTDYDCWKKDEQSVTWEMIKKRLEENAEKVKAIILRTLENFNSNNQAKKDIEFIKSKIRTIPDFPKPGIMFRDVTTLFKDAEAMQKTANLLYKRYQNSNIDAVAGIESRGFILGAILAGKLGCGFIPIRKKGKLPADTIQQEYDLEYGTDIIEIHKDSISPGQNILLVDDLIATGGSSFASCQLIEKLGGKIHECSFIVELPALNGRQKIANYPIFSLLNFEGD